MTREDNFDQHPQQAQQAAKKVEFVVQVTDDDLRKFAILTLAVDSADETVAAALDALIVASMICLNSDTIEGRVSAIRWKASELANMKARMDQLRRDYAAMQQESAVNPSHARLTSRIEQALKLGLNQTKRGAPSLLSRFPPPPLSPPPSMPSAPLLRPAPPLPPAPPPLPAPPLPPMPPRRFSLTGLRQAITFRGTEKGG